MEGTGHDDSNVHPEVVQTEQMGRCPSKDENAHELGKGDACDHRTAHFRDGSLGSIIAGPACGHKVRGDVDTKLHGQTNSHDHVDDGNGVDIHPKFTGLGRIIVVGRVQGPQEADQIDCWEQPTQSKTPGSMHDTTSRR